MNLLKKLIVLGIISFSQFAHAELALSVKINKTIGEKTIQIIKKVRANFNQDIVLNQEDSKEKIVLNFKKFNNITVNGNKINPIQVDMKTIDQDKKQIGKIKTITSFYQRQALFAGESLSGKWQVDLNFEEI
jgi:hypothetical protein